MSSNPYKPPVESALPPAAGDQRYSFRSLDLLAKVIMISVAWISLSALLVSTLELVFEFVWPGFNDPYLDYPSDAAVNASRVIMAIAACSLLFVLATLVAVPMFSWRSNANLRALGVRGLRFTPGWSAGYWFIPIVNLFRPFQATREVLVKSAPLKKNPTALAGWWWGTYLLGNALSRAESRLSLRGVYDESWFHLLSFSASGITVVAGILFILIVRRIWLGQQAMSEAKPPDKASAHLVAVRPGI